MSISEKKEKFLAWFDFVLIERLPSGISAFRVATYYLYSNRTGEKVEQLSFLLSKGTRTMKKTYAEHIF